MRIATLKSLNQLRPELAAAAQAVYDAWQQDEDGYDEELGCGGICHLIADEMLAVVAKHFPDTPMTTRSHTSEAHVDLVLATFDGVVCLDIPWSLYERGGGYTWTKLRGIQFHDRSIDIAVIDHNSRSFPEHVDEWDEVDELSALFPNEENENEHRI
jgi:hypothetical protein